MKKQAMTKPKKKPKVHKYSQPVGRPPKWASVKQLEKLIEEYFTSCWEPIMDYQLTAEAQAIKDAEPNKHHNFTKDDYEWVQRTDWQDLPLFKRVRPYSVTGLALALGTNRETLRDYGNKEKFSDTVERAKTIIQNYVEEGVLLGEISPLAGSFNLKNNFGWNDKLDVTSDNKELPTPIINVYRDHSNAENQGAQEAD